MKIDINVSDFYLDENDGLETGLKNMIKHEVIQSINKQIKDKVEAQITMEVKDTVEKLLYKQITSDIKEILETGTTKSRKDSNKQVLFKDYVRECFDYNGGWTSFEANIKKLAEAFSVELKQRYDLLFASQIVVKMQEQGLLKEDVVKLLLTPPAK